jgi:hypothetical protein
VSAATTLGELAPAGEPAAACMDCTFLSSAADAAPTSGVITRWAMRPGVSTPAGNSARLRIFRPVDGNGRVRMVAESASAPLTQGFPGADVRVPVEAGDRIGMQIDTPGGNTASSFVRQGFTYAAVQGAPGIGTELVPGSGSGQYFEWSGRRLNLTTILEPDADRDGFGDETQDACATDAATQGACPAPPAPPAPPADTVQPVLAFANLAARQRLGAGRVVLRVTSSEPATLVVSAVINVKRDGRAVKLAPRTVALAPGTATAVRLPLGSAARSIKAAARKGRKVTALVTLRVTDAAGNAKTYRRTIRLAR